MAFPVPGFLRPRTIGRRPVAAAILTLALALGGIVGVTGAGVGAERTLAGWNAALRRHPASGTLHIVEVDAGSIAAIDDWPWSRTEHARVVDRLRAAGASVIAFDIDFSSRSTRSGDAALAAAIGRAPGRVVLPTFRQASGSRDATDIDALPAPALRKHATLAAVSVLPDADGAVREAPMGAITDGTPRPSLSAMLAGRAGIAGAAFPIDIAIDPATVPRHSFIDIRDGRFDPASVRGRQFLIGATAIEMGDRYAIPNYGVVPGVVVQALAAETLKNGVPVRVGWPAALLVALGIAAATVRARRRVTLAVLGIVAPIAMFAAAVLLQGAFGLVIALVPGLVVLIVATGGAIAARLLRAWHDRRLHDPVTGLPNRQALVTALKSEAAAGVIVARIADFEKLASGLSTDATGQLLLRIADRIRLVDTDAALHRINDRMLAWPVATAIDHAAEAAATLRTLMLSPIEVAGRRIDVGLSLGGAMSAGNDGGRMIAQAALAAEQAHTTQSGWHLHTRAEDEAVDRELSLLGELTDAVANGELVVQYQPKLCIATNRVTSVEALVRWQHPTRGLLRPDLFVPLAEQNDRIEGLTLHVIARTIADLGRWSAAGHDLTAAVNLSAKLLGSTGFIADVLALLDSAAIAPERLIFEVTESAAMTDPDAALATLARFRALGIAISMDDYGTGQSTLSYLKRLPLTELKIDRSFVQFAHQNRGDAILVRSTIDLAHDLGLKVVAEGVEDAACLAFLASVHCDMAQGYHISRPIETAAVAALLDDRNAAAA